MRLSLFKRRKSRKVEKETQGKCCRRNLSLPPKCCAVLPEFPSKNAQTVVLTSNSPARSLKMIPINRNRAFVSSEGPGQGLG